MLICQMTDLHVCARGATANRVSETNMFATRAFRAATRMRTRSRGITALEVLVLRRRHTSGVAASYGLPVGFVPLHRKDDADLDKSP